MKTEKATMVRVAMGGETDVELFKYIEKNPNKTIYDISKSLGWSTGKVQKSLKRIGDKLCIEEEIVKGRLKKKYMSGNSDP